MVSAMLTMAATTRIRVHSAAAQDQARVTVLDRSPEFVALLTDILEDDGVLELRSRCVVMACHEPVTLEQVVDTRPTVLIIDPHFAAGTAGWELLGRIGADPGLRDVPVIMCTVEENGDPKAPRRTRGAFHVLTKPFRLDDLERVLLAAGL